MLTRRPPLTRPRCALVAAVATAGLLGTATALVPSQVPARPDAAVVALCQVALVLVAGWVWTATMSVVVEAWRGRAAGPRAPAALRRLVLVCCGAALLGSAGTASADEHPPAPAGISGLPMPDRALGPARPQPAPASASTVVVVEPGDCLWHLAASGLPVGAGPARVSARWQAIYRLNRALIGADPDVIRPGQRLVLPPSTR